MTCYGGCVCHRDVIIRKRVKEEGMHENKNRSHVERINPKSNIDFKIFTSLISKRRIALEYKFKQFCKTMTTDA